MVRHFLEVIVLKQKFFLLFFLTLNMHAQCISDEYKVLLAEAKVIFNKPVNYFCIIPPSNYFEIHPDFHQSVFFLTIINDDNQIMTCVSAMAYPKPIGKINKYLIATVDMNHISKNALAAQIDTHLSKLKYIKPTYLKKIKADRGYTYNIKVQDKYLGIYTRCKKIEMYKNNIGRAEILFFYKDNQQNIIDAEIEKTWGMLRFK